MLRGLTRSTSRRDPRADFAGEHSTIQSSVSEGTEFTTKAGCTSRLSLSIIACVIGSSFQVGYNLGVINAPQEIIKQFINESYHNQSGHYLLTSSNSSGVSDSLITWLWSLTVSIFCIGGMFGGLSAGFFANKYGRKGAILLNNIVLFLGTGMAAASIAFEVFELLIAARFVVGFNCGLSTGLGPLYLSEISPMSLRGLSGTLNQLAIVTGVLISQGLGLKSVLGRDTTDLMILFGITAGPALIQIILMPFCPESPLHLVINKNDVTAAKAGLVVLRGSQRVDDELDEILQEQRSTQNTVQVKMIDLFRRGVYRRPLIISLVLQCSQQLSGINAIIYYSTSVFSRTLNNELAAQYCTLATSGVNVLMTMVAAVLMDRAGRRTLHLVGLSVMMVSGALYTVGSAEKVTWLAIASIVLFIVGFGVGPGSIPWFIVAELFETGPRPSALSLSVLVNWFANFLVGFTFPYLQNLGDFSLLPFTGLLLVFVIYTFLQVPETKNRSFEEISRQFRRGSYLPLPTA